MRGGIGLLILFLGVQNLWALEGEVRTDLPGEHKKWGTFIGIGNPYPSLIGLNAAYNVNRNLRASVGYGEVEVTTSVGFSGNTLVEETVKAQTYSIGADYLFMDSGFWPVIGVKAGYFNVSGDGDFEVQGIDDSTGLLYGNLGFDWMAESGLNVGGGFNVAAIGGSGANFYANIGYFF